VCRLPLPAYAKASAGRRGRGSKIHRARKLKDLRPRESAGDDLVASVPRVRMRDRPGVDAPVPAVGAPAAADRPDLAVGHGDVEDVSVAVREQDALLAVSLSLHHLVHLTPGRQDRLHITVTAKLGNDRAIHGRLTEPVERQGGFRRLGLHQALREALGVVVHPADRNLSGLPLLLCHLMEAGRDVEGREYGDGVLSDLLEDLGVDHCFDGSHVHLAQVHDKAESEPGLDLAHVREVAPSVHLRDV